MADSLYVRRCHFCGEVNESPHDILKCQSCRKSLLPFYYFDKRKVPDYADNEERPLLLRDRESGYGPLRGLTAFW